MKYPYKTIFLVVFMLYQVQFLTASDYSVLDDDAGMVSLNSPAMPFGVGLADVNMTLQNFGSNSILNVTINWEVNGVLQPIANWTGNLSAGNTLSIDVGSYDFQLGVNYEIKAWTSFPNGNADSQTQNDTIVVKNLYASLSGQLTIGGIDPDFNTFEDAVDHLHLGGIMDTVHFLVRPGTYAEQIVINEFPGSNCMVPVIFQSESGDSSDVVLTYSNTNTQENYTLFLNGADGIRFESITLEATVKNYGNVVRIDNEANCNTFSHCHFKAPIADIYFFNAHVFSNGSKDNNNSFISSFFENGNIGLFLRGQGSSHTQTETNTRVEGCTFLNYNYAIQTFGLSDYKFYNNQITSHPLSPLFIGMYIAIGKPGEIIQNKIEITHRGTGIWYYYVEGNSGNKGLVANNFIAVGGENTGFGFNIESCEYHNFYHNNIHIHGSDAFKGCAARFRSNGHLDVKNNLFINSQGGYTTSHLYPESTNDFDYNNLYTNGSILAQWNGELISDLSDFQAISNHELNSLSVDPLYASATDLHANKALLDGVGIQVDEVTDDIDDEIRMNPPDLGADEFVPVGTNSGLSYISYPTAPFAEGSHTIEVAIQNTGATVLTSVDIQWQVNEILQTVFHWTGALQTGEKDTISLGSFDFLPIQKYMLKVWVESPNDVADIDSSDDTLSVDNIYTALEGTFTIGGVDPDFPTIYDATEALVKGGVMDTTSFSLRSGTYTELIELLPIPGGGCTMPVAFESETGDSSDVVITYPLGSGQKILLNLNGADGLIFKNLTFKATGSGGHVVRIQNEASCNSFYNNALYGVDKLSAGFAFSVIYSPATQDTCNVFCNNLIKDGSYAICFLGNYYFYTNGTVIKNNKAVNNSFRGFRLEYQSNLIFDGNSVSTNSTNRLYIGLLIDQARLGITISNNEIEVLHGQYGMFIDFYLGSNNYFGLISNNFVSLGGTDRGHGIYLYATYTRFLNNSVSITNTDPTSSALNFYQGFEVHFNNNILANFGGGYSFYNYSESPYAMLDHNNLYSTGSILGYWNNIPASTLNNWQSITGMDSNSVSLDPGFVSTTDLHLDILSPKSKGISYPEVLYDIDGDLRNAQFPNIGADEYQCPDILNLKDKVIGDVHSLNAGVRIILDNVSFLENSQITLTAPELSINTTSTIKEQGILKYAQQNGCDE
ncbi:MAG: right-handed parallel beta-helix repeat-containing protein [Bacteroidota bacterium]